MGRFGRAAGVAVAGMTLVLGSSLTAPSLAEDAHTAASVPYIQHAATAPVLDAAINQDVIEGLPKTGAVESDLPAPVAIHAVATIDPSARYEVVPAPAPRPLS